jgi:PAS domain-containing protein
MTKTSRRNASRPTQRAGPSAGCADERPASERRLSSERAVLVVDAGGAVRFCGDRAAQLLDTRSEDILGRPIQSLIPDLPLQNATLGYNVAYTCFWSVQDDWRRFHRSASNGRAAPLEVKLKPAQRRQDDPYALVVRLRGAAN